MSGTLFDMGEPQLTDKQRRARERAQHARRNILLGDHPLSIPDRVLRLLPSASDVPDEPERGPQCAGCVFAVNRSSGWRCDNPFVFRPSHPSWPAKLDLSWPACEKFSSRF